MFDLTAAVIGTGMMGKTHIGALKKLVKNLIISGNDVETGEALSKELGVKFYSDYKVMLKEEKLDFVSVCLPTHFHCEATLEALKNGVNVLCEKPFAASSEEAAVMIEAAKKAGKTLMVAHPLRFYKPYEYVRRAVQDKRFGELVYADFYRHSENPGWSIGNWLADPKLSGGVIKDFHIHDTDMITGLFGVPESVHTMANTYACSTGYFYPDKKVVTSSSSWRTVKDFPFTSGFDVVFENASLVLKGTDFILYTDKEDREFINKEAFEDYFSSDDFYENEIHYFCHCLTNSLKPELCMPENTLNSMLVNEAEMKGAQTGKAESVK